MPSAIQPQFATRIITSPNLKGKVVIPARLAQTIPPAPITGKEAIR